MENRELRGFITGIIVTLLIFIMAFAWINYSSLLLKYSGVLTFYSLLFLVVFYIYDKIRDRVEERENNRDILLYISKDKELIQKQVNKFYESTAQKNPPDYSLIEFNQDQWLPWN